MDCYQRFLLGIIFLFGVVCFQQVSAEVTADPFGLAVTVENNDTLQTEMILSNDLDHDMAYVIRMSEVDNIMGRDANLPGGDAYYHPGPRRDRRSDPDDAGYFWVDSDEDDGPEYDWIDIANREGAERLQVQDNWISGVLELGFEFPWYGEWYPSVRVCSNGW